MKFVKYLTKQLQRQRVRTYLYRLSAVALPALTTFGVMSDSTAGVVFGLVGAVLSAGPGTLAAANPAERVPAVAR
jgi:hypothetical protein